MAEGQHSRKRRRQQQQQADQRSDSVHQSEKTDEPKPTVVRGRDAATQTSPPPSPHRVTEDDEADLSSLLLQPQLGVHSPSQWLAWIQLSSFTQSNAAETVAAAATSTTTALSMSTSSAVSNSASSNHSSTVAAPTPLSKQALITYPASSSSSSNTPLPQRYSSHTIHPLTVPSTTAASGAAGSTAPTASSSTLHLRPNSAVVLPLHGLHPPLIDSRPAAVMSQSTNRPAVLPWMNKHSAVVNTRRNLIG